MLVYHVTAGKDYANLGKRGTIMQYTLPHRPQAAARLQELNRTIAGAMMAFNYEAICEENQRSHGTGIGRIGPMLLADRYDDRTHIIFQLL